LREKIGFPNDNFSLKNLQDNNLLIVDFVNNPYINIKCTIMLYSTVVLFNGNFYAGKYQISKKRVLKNIDHLYTILNNQSKYHSLITKNINKLNSMIS
jgi:hypothetical protein